MSGKIANAAYLAEQVAGSCRLEGIMVSKAQLTVMEQIISGQVNAKKLRAQLVERYRQSNGQ